MRVVATVFSLCAAFTLAGCQGAASRPSSRLPDPPALHLEPPNPSVAQSDPRPPPPLRGVKLNLNDRRLGYLPFFACGSLMIEAPPEIHGLIDLFGGPENYAAALAAERVEVIVLQPVKSDDTTRYDELSGFPLSDEDAAILRAVLTSDGTYDWSEGYPDFDDPEYSFRVKLRSRGRVVTVDLSMSEGIARVVIGGREVARQHFTFGYDTIASLLERHFPNSVETLRNKG